MDEKTVALEEILSASEQLSTDDQLRLIGLLSERLRGKVERTDEPIDMLSLAGEGAEMWRELDASAYLEEERDSWER